MKHVYFLYSSYFSNSNNVWRKPIKHERNVHNIKRHRSSINRGSRVSKGARCRSIDKGGGEGRERGKLIREIWLWTVCLYVAARESVEREIRQLQFYRILSPSNLQCPTPSRPSSPPALFPSRLFSTNFSLFHPSSLLFFAISIFVRISLLLSLLMKKKEQGLHGW